MHGPPDHPAAKRQRLARRALSKRKWRALLGQGGKVLTLQIKDKNRLISALENTRWIGKDEDSEDWQLVADRVAIMLAEFAQTYGDEPMSPMDSKPVKPVPSSKA